MTNVTDHTLRWQSRAVLLIVMPFTAIGVLLQSRDWLLQAPQVAWWTLGLSTLLGMTAWAARSGTPAAALLGALTNACLMFATAGSPYRAWQTAVLPVMAVLLLTSFATRFGRSRKEGLGLAEKRKGRVAAQVAANLGVAALVSLPAVHFWFLNITPTSMHPLFFALALAALAEAAADTVSSEVGQVLGGRPFLLTTLRRVDPGTDGAISAAGTFAGIVAAAIVTGAAALVLPGGWRLFLLGWAGGVFGLFFDSLLGATLERAGWLNNDAVNFLSTASAAAFALAMLNVFR